MKVPVPKVIIATDTLKEREQISGAREDVSVKREQIHITQHEKVNISVKMVQFSNLPPPQLQTPFFASRFQSVCCSNTHVLYKYFYYDHYYYYY